MPMDLPVLNQRSAVSKWVVGVLGIAVIGAVDYYSGAEIRVFPLYYLPLAVLSWGAGRTGAAVATVLCSAFWVGSNVLAGMRYTAAGVWLVNTAMQTASFATVGLLIATVRDSLLREHELSRSDPLTGILNRKGFYEQGSRLLALCRRTHRPITVAYLDLDNFKAVNDRFGHERGDEVLRAAARALLAAVRPSDIAARLGGDEFIVLFPEVGGTEARVALERLRVSLAGALTTEPVPVSASVGGVVCSDLPEDIQDLLRASDAQMYAAKASGRNRVELHELGSWSLPPPSTGR